MLATFSLKNRQRQLTPGSFLLARCFFPIFSRPGTLLDPPGPPLDPFLAPSGLDFGGFLAPFWLHFLAASALFGCFCF